MIKNKKIAIYGFAKEGLAAANYLGEDNEIHLYDKKPRQNLKTFIKELKSKKAKFCFGGAVAADIKYDYVVRSPGVNPGDPFLKKLLSEKTILTSGTQIFFEECPGRIIGVTGTKGKGTTSSLIFEMLKSQYKDVYLAGNIGLPAIDLLKKLNEKSIVVLELSSFQLQDIRLSPSIAVVLMVTSEHLNWHKDTKEYVGAKSNIVKFQKNSDFAVINDDFQRSIEISKIAKSKIYFFSTEHNTNGVYIKDKSIISEINGHQEIAQTSDVFIPGRHNLQNVSAAVTVALLKKIPVSNIKAVLKNFKGLEHRLQFVKNVDGVAYYNDSFSTTPETAVAALAAFNKPKVIILGGSSKKSNFKDLAQAIVKDEHLVAIILIGEEAGTIYKAIKSAGNYKGRIVKGAKNMNEIVKAARTNAKKGGVVILSPACASFDMFENYKNRGDLFTKEIYKL